MMLYELFNRVEVSTIDETFLSKAKLIYGQLTTLEKTMVDKRIIINNDYPTYYWKLLAAIYLTITKKILPKITDKYLHKIGFSSNNRIRSLSLDENERIIESISIKGIRSIYDLYINFNVAYRPFKRNNIDEKIESLGYNINSLPSMRDKIIIKIKDLMNKHKLHPAEFELMRYPIFINHINFMSFYETLSNFKLEDREHISWPELDYEILQHRSKIFALEINNKIVINMKKVIHSILTKKYGINRFFAYNFLKKIISGNYDLNLSDIYFVFDLLKFFFEKFAMFYIVNILFVLKMRNIPVSIIAIYDKMLLSHYINIEISLEYVVANYTIDFVKFILDKFEINNNNVTSILGKCKNIEIFTLILNRCKELGIVDIAEGVKEFTIHSLSNINFDLGKIISLFDDFDGMMFPYKNEIFAIYIEKCDFNSVRNFINCFNNYNFNTELIRKAVGRSRSIEMFQLIYGCKYKYDSELLKDVIIHSCSKGSDIFLNHFHKFSSKMDISDIVLSLSESNNIILMKKYRAQIPYYVFEQCIIKTIRKNNITMFSYLWFESDHLLMNTKEMITIACELNKRFFLEILLKDRKYDLKFYVDIFNLCSKKSNKYILNMILSYIGNIVDINFPIIQLFTLKTGIYNIIKYNTKEVNEWLKENLNVLPIFKTFEDTFEVKIRKRRNIIHHFSENSYISSDDEEDNEEIEENFIVFKHLKGRNASF